MCAGKLTLELALKTQADHHSMAIKACLVDILGVTANQVL